MDMFEQAIQEVRMKIQAQADKAMVDAMLLPLFEEESMETARVFFHALIDNGCPAEAIVKALKAASSRG